MEKARIIEQLRQNESKLLQRVASDLENRKREVNLSRINHFTKEDDMIIVPGKVLGGGELSHKVTIAAYKFSDSAKEKLVKNGSKIIPMNEITKDA
ncbi:50S ribosomal protein L18e, partial [Candidatus Woesearchaeota archaeon]|nr:50S ribosomal protein L18e [Candidatus Woesearchaeota archaeon]